MKLEVLPHAFSVCKVADYAGIDPAAPFVFAGATDAEKSLVCPTDSVPAATLAREDGWRAFRVAGPLDFSLVGILARISSALAAERIGLFAVSTFDTDYILVKAPDLGRALAALSRAGVAVDDDGTVLGLYILHPNNVGRCGHIANASYAVRSLCRGRHLGEKLVLDCLAQAKAHGFGILQFNAVVEGNVHARHLYERLGFKQLGTIPRGFRMKDGTFANICPYYKEV